LETDLHFSKQGPFSSLAFTDEEVNRVADAVVAAIGEMFHLRALISFVYWMFTRFHLTFDQFVVKRKRNIGRGCVHPRELTQEASQLVRKMGWVGWSHLSDCGN
jgi:hypothetical protein